MTTERYNRYPHGRSNCYNHANIYKMIDNTTGLFYIGSSCMELRNRYYNHKTDSSKENRKSSKLYANFTREKFDSGDIRILLIEEVNVENKRELQKIENEYIQKELKNVLCINTRSSFLTPDNRLQQRIKSDKKYRDTHKEERKIYDASISEIRNEHFDCECGGKYSRKSKARHEKCQKHIKYIETLNKS